MPDRGAPALRCLPGPFPLPTPNPMSLPSASFRLRAGSRRRVLAFPAFALALLAGGPAAAGAAEAAPVPKIAGIRVVAFTPEPLLNENDPVNRPWPFNSDYQPLCQGMTIDVLIPCPSGGFLTPEDDGEEPPQIGKILKAVDSRGKDLTAPRVHRIEGNAWPVEAAIREVRITDDGSAAAVSLFVPQTPTPGAGSIDLRAEVTLKHCPKTEEFKAAGANLRRKGTTIQLGAVELKVGEIKSYEHQGRRKEYVRLETRDDIGALRAIELRANGKTLRALDLSSLRLNNGPDSPRSMTCGLQDLPEKVDLVASFYQDIDKPASMSIPIALTAGIGLAAGKDGEAPLAKVGPEDPLVTVAGFEIVDSSIPRRARGSYQTHGTTIALTLVRADRGIVRIDPEQSKIVKFTDSTGKDLTTPIVDKELDSGKILPGWGDPTIAEGGVSAGLVIEVPQAPAAGADRVHFSATIALLCSDGTDEFKATPAGLNVRGKKFEAGPFRFEVTEPKATGKGDRRQPCKIEMKTRSDLRGIKQVALKAGDRTHEARRFMSSRSGEENTAVWDIPGLDELPVSAEIVVTVEKDRDRPKTVMVPVEGSIGLGLPPQR